MVWALLPLLFFSFILGIIAIERDLASIKPPAAPETVSADTAGQEFMAYRNAVIAYAEARFTQQFNSVPPNPIPVSDLTFQTAGLPSSFLSDLSADGASNIIGNPEPVNGVSPTPQMAANGYYVCVWMKVPAAEISQTVNELGGDLTIGTVLSSRTTWRQAGPHGQILPIPEVCLMGEDPGSKLSGLSYGNFPAGDMISVVGLAENAPVTSPPY